jgi:hypothetical protein
MDRWVCSIGRSLTTSKQVGPGWPMRVICSSTEGGTSKFESRKDQAVIETSDLSGRPSLWNATFLISDPETLIFLFPCDLGGSELVFLGGAAGD